MKIAHIADIHLCERVRFDGTLRVLDAFAAGVETNDVDLVIIAGDLVDPRRAPARATPAERNAFARVVVRLATQCPVVIVRGNHDALGDWTFLELLETDHVVRYFEEPGVVRLGPWEGPPVYVHAVPWLSPAWFAGRVADLGLSIEDGNAWVEDAVRPVFDTIGQARKHFPDDVHIGVGHISVRGGRLANGQALIGHEVQIGAYQLAALGLHYFGLGHLHEAQAVAEGYPVWYSGSPNRLDFGEAGKACGWVLATIEPGAACAMVEFVDLPADRLVTVEAQLLGGSDGVRPYLDVVEVVGVSGVDLLPDEIVGAEIRLRVLIPEGLHAEDAIAELVAYIEENGATVTVQRITVAAMRAREGAEDVAAAATVADKVSEFLTQRKHDKQQVARVLRLLEAIEGARA